MNKYEAMSRTLLKCCELPRRIDVGDLLVEEETMSRADAFF
nr:hypothetical protein [Evansella caseinilytica]